MRKLMTLKEIKAMTEEEKTEDLKRAIALLGDDTEELIYTRMILQRERNRIFSFRRVRNV